MLDGLAFTFAEAQDCPRTVGVAEPCNTLLHAEGDRTLVRRTGFRGNTTATNCNRQQHRDQMIASGEDVRIGRFVQHV